MADRPTRLSLPGDCPWLDGIHHYTSTDSTNTQAKHLAKAGAPHGTVLIADSQTGGRGRMGRTFVSPAGQGIYLSVILRPSCPPDRLMHLTCAVAVAMCDAVESVAGFRPGAKWINDLVCGGRKLGGILTELSLDTATGLTEYAVVGIGINCNQQLSHFPAELQDMAGSLQMVTGQPVDRAALAAAMITALWQMDKQLLTDKPGLMARYRTDCITLGQDVAVHGADTLWHGKAIDMDADGALLIRRPDGSLCTVGSGEVSVRGLYGYI